MKLSSGDLLVEASENEHFDNFLKLKQFARLLVTISPHRSLNRVQDVISERDLIGKTDSDLFQGFREKGVIALRRITLRRNGEEVVTPHIVLTLNRPRLPDSVKAEFIRCKVRAYVPNPRRCYKCQKYGYGSNTCGGKLTRAKCGAHGHPTELCSATRQERPNCHGPHPAYSRTYEMFQNEKK